MFKYLIYLFVFILCSCGGSTGSSDNNNLQDPTVSSYIFSSEYSGSSPDHQVPLIEIISELSVFLVLLIQMKFQHS